MRFVLGCLGVVFVIFGGCVLAIFGSEGVASGEVAFAIGALLLFSFGIWAQCCPVNKRIDSIG